MIKLTQAKSNDMFLVKASQIVSICSPKNRKKVKTSTITVKIDKESKEFEVVETPEVIYQLIEADVKLLGAFIKVTDAYDDTTALLNVDNVSLVTSADEEFFNIATGRDELTRCSEIYFVGGDSFNTFTCTETPEEIIDKTQAAIFDRIVQKEMSQVTDFDIALLPSSAKSKSKKA